jgi:hypothetical protein
MSIFDSNFSKIADKILKRSKNIEEYNKLFLQKEASFEKKIEKLKVKLTENYKLFSVKPQHSNILKDVERDILVVKSLQNVKKPTESQNNLVNKMCNKYSAY